MVLALVVAKHQNCYGSTSDEMGRRSIVSLDLVGPGGELYRHEYSLNSKKIIKWANVSYSGNIREINVNFS